MSIPGSRVGPKGALDRLVSPLLSMSPGEQELVSALRNLRFRHMARLLHHHVATLADVGVRKWCLETLRRLPEDAVDHLLRSPALCGIVRAGEGNNSVPALIDAERVLSESTNHSYRERWSALGNVWLGRNVSREDVPLEEREGRWVGPALRCGIPLDLSLPDRPGRPTGGLRDPGGLDRVQLIGTIEALDRAIDMVRDTSPSGYGALSGLTSNIVLRVDRGRSRESWGASSGVVIGRTLLVNPLAAGDPALLGEFLLHEATHTALDCAELENPLIADASPAGRTVISPWTGNPLSLHAFVHAYAVWAVLLEYWVRYRELFPGSRVAEKRFDFIRRGFRHHDGNDGLEVFSDNGSHNAARIVTAALNFAGAID